MYIASVISQHQVKTRTAMQRIFQSAKRLISMCIVTVLLVTSALTSLPAPARAEGNITINNIDCRNTINPQCGNVTSPVPSTTDTGFVVGAALGALISSGIIDTVVTAATPLAAPAASALTTVGAAVGNGIVDSVVSTGVASAASAIGHAAMMAAAPLAAAAAPAVVAAAPVAVPVAATAAAGYVGYRAWEAHHKSQAQSSK